MGDKERVQVVIRGRTYHLAGGDPEYTRKLAKKVDEALARFSDGTPGADNYQLAILTALHLADELATVSGQYDSYRSRVDGFATHLLDALDSRLGPEEPPEPGEPEEQAPESD